MSVPRIVATPGQEAEFRVAAEEYQAAEAALKAAYREVSQAKYRKKQAMERMAQFASIKFPAERPVPGVPKFRHPPEPRVTGVWVDGWPRERGHLSECPVVTNPELHCTCDDDSPEWTTS